MWNYGQCISYDDLQITSNQFYIHATCFAIYIQMLMQAQPVICNKSYTMQLKVQKTS